MNTLTSLLGHFMKHRSARYSVGLACFLSVSNLPAQQPAVSATVPAGGELIRTYDAAEISVHLVSRPFFSPEPTGWPALEVGPASLTFTRDTAGGGLVLLGDKPLSLPFVIAVGADGRSQQPLDFTLSFSRPKSAATLLLEGLDFTLPATAAPDPLRVAVTAGQTHAWPLEKFEITVLPAEANAKGGANDVGSTAPRDPNAEPPKPSADLAFGDAARQSLRLANAVSRKTITPAQALEALRKASASRLKIAPDLAFGLAAITAGEELVANGKFGDAEIFFRGAEEALSTVRSHATRKLDEALCLKKLALIRSLYLAKRDQAAEDIETASRLTPTDRNLDRLREQLTGRTTAVSGKEGATQ